MKVRKTTRYISKYLFHECDIVCWFPSHNLLRVFQWESYSQTKSRCILLFQYLFINDLIFRTPFSYVNVRAYSVALFCTYIPCKYFRSPYILLETRPSEDITLFICFCSTDCECFRNSSCKYINLSSFQPTPVFFPYFSLQS